MPVLEVTDNPAESDLSVISSGIINFNEADIGPSNRHKLAVLIRDDDGKVIGGISGSISWGWLFIQVVFMPEAWRGQGMAAALLSKVEEEARARDCRNAWIDTFNPQALRAYQRHGYEVFGQLPDYPPGRTRVFLKKAL